MSQTFEQFNMFIFIFCVLLRSAHHNNEIDYSMVEDSGNSNVVLGTHNVL
jgi:hypothetical protein